MIDCDFCNGERYIGGVQQAGPCVCVTPENMRALEVDADEFQRLRGDEGVYLDRLSDAHEAMRRYFVRVGLGRDPLVIDDPDLREVWEKVSG